MLTDREKQILEIAVEEYILRGVPVGSKYLLKKYKMGFSPATLRIILKKLEEKGYLTHLSFSSGRIPTDSGYRFYVKNLASSLKKRTVPELEYAFSNKNISSIIKESLRIISEICSGCGFGVIQLKKETTILKAEFLPLDKAKIILIIVLKNGEVLSQVFNLDFEVSKKDIRMINIFLKDVIEGKISEEKKENLEEGERKLYSIYDKAVNRVKNEDSYDIFTYKSKKLLRNQEKGKWMLFDILDDSLYFNRILNRILKERGIYVYIGEENFLEFLKNFSLIGISYEMEERKRVILGVIGFKRMNYEEILTYFKTIYSKFLKLGRRLK